MVLADRLALAGARADDHHRLRDAHGQPSRAHERYAGVSRTVSLRIRCYEAVRCGEPRVGRSDDEDFDEALRSDVADVKQCAGHGMGESYFSQHAFNRFSCPKDSPGSTSI